MLSISTNLNKNEKGIVIITDCVGGRDGARL